MRESVPNILLITCDQLRYDFIGTTSGGKIYTPNINRLANQGCLYENAYSPNPVCIPARHNLITGLTDRLHGFDDNYFGKEAKSCPYYLPTFAQILRDGGYETIAIGKMHFQPERNAAGFDFFYNMNEVVPTREMDDYAMYLKQNGFGHIHSIHGVRNCLYMQPQRSLLPEKYHGSAWVADQAIEYLDRTRGRQPFMMWAGFIHPHPPLDVPERWADYYRNKIDLPVTSITPLSKLAEENKYLACMDSLQKVNRVRELYAAAISFADEQIGRILEKLDELDLAENTLVVFTSDHGEMLGDLGTYQKFLPYDAASRIPLILRYPGRIIPGRRNASFADLNDLLPTFLGVAHLRYPASYDLPGESLLETKPKKDRDYQYLEHQHGSKRWCAIRDIRYKYIHYYGDEDQLFDLAMDPHETFNLLFCCKEKDIYKRVKQLRQRLIYMEERYGLEGYTYKNEFIKFPPYQISPSFEETMQPFAQKLISEEAELMNNVDDEILAAIKNEPTVKLHTAETVAILSDLGYSDERMSALFERARQQGN